jgi:type I restriction-modification system DNA methylase subunit
MNWIAPSEKDTDTATRGSANLRSRRERQLLANPPFNDSDWFRKDDEVRWQFGVPPKGNANFARLQHFIHHLAPQGMAGLVPTNGSSATRTAS